MYTGLKMISTRKHRQSSHTMKEFKSAAHHQQQQNSSQPRLCLWIQSCRNAVFPCPHWHSAVFIFRRIKDAQHSSGWLNHCDKGSNVWLRGGKEQHSIPLADKTESPQLQFS